MKLLLHWLLWDLRRFRWPLLAWTALVTGFVCYLGWLHRNILTIPSGLLSYNEGIAAVLGIIEFFLLLHILTTDPAAGVHPFWKTRPPSGFALAGAKAVLVLLFFLALPMLAHWTMRRVCGLDGDGHTWSGHSWAWMLWWTECHAISVLVLVASGARSAGHALGRLAAGAGVLFIPVLISMILGWEAESAAARWMHEAFRSIHNGIFSLRPVTAWLFAGLTVFLFIRRTRTPSRPGNAAPLYLPAAALIAGAWLAEDDQLRHRAPALAALAALPAEIVSTLKIGEPLLRGGIIIDTSEYVDNIASPTAPGSGFSLYLHLAGLPPDCVATSRWQDLRLIHPDGQTLIATEETLQFHGMPMMDHGDGILRVGGIRFPGQSLSPFSRAVCRAKGTLRVMVLRRQSAAIPIEAGQRIRQASDTVLLRDTTGILNPVPDQELFDLAVENRGQYSTTGFWLQHIREPEKRLGLAGNGWSSTSGYFMHYRRNDQTLSLAGDASPLAQAYVRRAVEQNTLSDWRLHAAWLDPVGTADVPVVLEDLFIPRQPGDERKAEDIVAALSITPEMSVADVTRTVKFALALPEISRLPNSKIQKNSPLIKAIGGLLDTVPRAHLPVLLNLAGEELPGWNANQAPSFDPVFRQHLAALMEAPDVTALRGSRPQLFRSLRFELALRKLIPDKEAHDPDWEEMAGDQLLAVWKREKYYLNDGLKEMLLTRALRRGLPWAWQETAEFADLLPNAVTTELSKAFSKISDCPAEPKSAISWIKQNAARLTWDAAAKRWVLPPP